MWARGASVAGAIGWVLAGCSGSGTTTTYNRNGTLGNGALGNSLPLPDTLVNECDKICENVVAECTDETPLLNTCLTACNDLGLVNLGCVDTFATYLTCLAGSTTVSCTPGSIDVLVSPPECAADRQAAISCTAGPGLISACIAVPGNGECNGEISSQPTFCIGAPDTCISPAPNPLGIGVYCCP
jgi:hypothetical protein